MDKKIGKVLELFISKKGDKNRTNITQISLDENGIIGDKFYALDIQRSVLITSLHSYEITKSHNIDMPYGALGENILINYNPYHLNIGTKIKIGDVILEISQPCTLCNHLSKINKAVPKLLKDDRGIFAKVIKNGQINKNDNITLI